MVNEDYLPILETISSGGVQCKMAEADKVGKKLVKSLVKENGDNKKDYKYALMEIKLDGKKYLTSLCKTPGGGYLTLRYTDLETKKTFIPNKIFMNCHNLETGEIELLEIFGFTKDKVPEDAVSLGKVNIGESA